MNVLGTKDREPTPRSLAYVALKSILKDGRFSKDVLHELTKESGLSALDRGLLSELVYGVLRNLEYLDFVLDHVLRKGLKKTSKHLLFPLRVAAYELLFLEKIPDYASVNEAVSFVRARKGPQLAGVANGALQSLIRNKDTLPDASAYLRYSFPEWVRELLPKEVSAEACAEGFYQKASLVLRVNRTQTTSEELSNILAEYSPQGHPLVPGALSVASGGKLLDHETFSQGLWSVQDAGAQWVTEESARRAGESPKRVLDLCCGLGGKTLHMAEAFPMASIVAVDPAQWRLEKLEESTSRLGVSNIHTVCAKAQDFQSEEKFDVVLVDAPCSGLGVLRRHPEAKWRTRSDSEIGELAQEQLAILTAAADQVASGGMLVYCVCTFTPQETVEVVSELKGWDVEFERTLWPHLDQTDGFYCAWLRRSL